jgi:hypothetical protein
MDTLRQITLKRGIPAREKDVPAFHNAFLKTVRMGGRVYELGMIGLYKLKTFSFFKDMRLGREMFNRGKLKVLPDMIKGRKEIKKIFKDAKRGN